MATGIKSFVQAPDLNVDGQPASIDDTECSSDNCSSLLNTSKDQSAGENEDSDFTTAEKAMMKYKLLRIFQTPLCMIDSDADGNLQINKDVLDELAKIDSPLSIVAITGPYRSGKSYLLNRLAGLKEGFQVGSTAKAVTKGMWAWCRLHPNCKGQVLLLLDTEGTGNIEEDQGDFENQLLTLAILLCSTFIYNCKGAMDRSLLEKLQFVTEMSNLIQLSDTNNDTDSNDLDLYLPFFLLVLRDFDYTIDGDDEHKYFENIVLTLKTKCSQKEQMFNNTRRCIRDYFKRRKCFTFVSPGLKEIVNNMQDAPDENIHADFIKKCREFTEFVYNQCPPKQVNNGQAIDGGTFAILTRTYVEQIGSGMVPKVKNVLTMVTQEVNYLAVQRCIQLYQSEMAIMLQFPTSSDTTLSEAHKICSDHATSLFLKVSISEEDGKFLKLANEQIFTAYENFKHQDENESVQKSETVLKDLGTDITTKIKTKSYLRRGGYNLYRKDIQELEKKFKETNGLGCKKDEVWSKYLIDKCADEDQMMMVDAELSEKDKEIEAERKKAIEAEREQRDMQFRLIRQKRMHEIEQERLTASHLKQQNKIKEEIDHQKKHHNDILQKRLQEQKRLLSEGFDNRAEQLNSQINALIKRLEEIEVQQAKRQSDMKELEARLDTFNKMGAFKLIRTGMKKLFTRKTDI